MPSRTNGHSRIPVPPASRSNGNGSSNGNGNGHRALSGGRAVIMAGGLGTRLAPYTHVLPKPLMPVDGKPILEVVLRQLKAHGFERVTICAGYLAELITAYFGAGEKLGLEVDYSIEHEPSGTIGPLRRIDDFTEPILVMNGDILTALDFADLYRTHLTSRPILTIATCPQRVEMSLGVMEFDGSREVTQFREKPRIDFWVSMGTYVAAPEVLDYLPAEGAFGFDDLVAALQADGVSPMAYPFEGVWHDLAEAEDCRRATESFQKHRDILLP